MVDHAPVGAILDAVAFAADRHRNQRRKGDEASPYVNHPIAVAHVLWHEGGVRDGVTIAAALLHDTVEDTDTTFEQLEERFGAEVAGVVREVTDDKSLPKAERKRLQVQHAADASLPAQQVKLADKICNLRDIANSPPTGWDLERRRAYFDWAKRVVDALRGAHPQLEAVFDETLTSRP